MPDGQEADYANLIASIVAVAQPRDAIEEILTRDFIDLTWEILRLRRLKAGLLRSSIGSGISTVMRSFGYDGDNSHTFGEQWARGDESTKNKVTDILQKAQLTIEDVMAETLASKIDTFERIDRLLASAEARRNNALREIDRHREALGAAMRQAIGEVEDAEFRDVETGELGGGKRP